MRISQLGTLAKTAISTTSDYLLTANNVGNSNRKVLVNDLFPTITNYGSTTGAVSIITAVANKNEYTISKIVAGSTKLSVTGGGGAADISVDLGTVDFAHLTGNIVNSQLAGAIDVTTKLTGTLPIANGGTGSTATTFCDLTANVTGTLPTTGGGTGLTSFTANKLFYASSTSAIAQLDTVGAAGRFLLGSGSKPTWVAATNTSSITWTTTSSAFQAQVIALPSLTGNVAWTAGSDRTVAPATASGSAGDVLNITSGASSSSHIGGDLNLTSGTGGASGGSNVVVKSGTGSSTAGDINFLQQDGSTSNFTHMMRLYRNMVGVSNNQGTPTVPEALLDIEQSNTGGAIPAVHIEQQDDNVEFIKLTGAGGSGTAYNLDTEPDGDTSGSTVAAPHSAAWTLKGMVRIKVSDGSTTADRYIPYYLRV